MTVKLRAEFWDADGALREVIEAPMSFWARGSLNGTCSWILRMAHAQLEADAATRVVLTLKRSTNTDDLGGN